MPDSTTIPLVFAIAIPNLFLYGFMDKLIKQRTDEVATGVFHGVAVSLEHRELTLNTSWLIAVTTGIGLQSIFTLGYWELSNNTDAYGVRAFALIYTYFSALGVFGWVWYAVRWYLRLTSLLRQGWDHSR
jgi:hypothetical protein